MQIEEEEIGRQTGKHKHSQTGREGEAYQFGEHQGVGWIVHIWLLL
jgi:hypothetical protein